TINFKMAISGIVITSLGIKKCVELSQTISVDHTGKLQNGRSLYSCRLKIFQPDGVAVNKPGSDPILSGILQGRIIISYVCMRFIERNKFCSLGKEKIIENKAQI